MWLPGFSVDQGNTQICSGNKAALVNILREQENQPNFGGSECGNLEKTWDKTFATSADSDQPASDEPIIGNYRLTIN